MQIWVIFTRTRAGVWIPERERLKQLKKKAHEPREIRKLLQSCKQIHKGAGRRSSQVTAQRHLQWLNKMKLMREEDVELGSSLST